jgi:hypothetical protein
MTMQDSEFEIQVNNETNVVSASLAGATRAPHRGSMAAPGGQAIEFGHDRCCRAVEPVSQSPHVA